MALSETKIIEYTTTILEEKGKGEETRIWCSKRINPAKEFFNHWQVPGGHIEKADINIRKAAQREVLEETGILIEIKDLKYAGTYNYFRNGTWRIVYGFSAQTDKIPQLTEPREMTKWILAKPNEIYREQKVIDSLRSILHIHSIPETKIIIIEGTCGVGKTTFANKCKEYLRKKGKWAYQLDESFIHKDENKRLLEYGRNLEKYRKNKISKEEMRKNAIKFEIWIRDNWMEQIYLKMTNVGRCDFLILDRNLHSTLIFMETMKKEGFLEEEDIKEISKNYKYWNFLNREALVIWWNTPLEESIKRLQNRGRDAEKDIEYYKTLHETYSENILKVYPNIKIVTKETLVEKDQLDELIPDIINEKEINNRARSYWF
jgi:thymidylate kinase/8-oxo-dGTP pyrophosphatase MutT (NUDIX family)